VYNDVINSSNDFNKIVRDFCNEINEEISQATGMESMNYL
jgi:hypothetical protein